MIKAAVCDDNKEFAQRLCKMIKRQFGSRGTGVELTCFTSGEELVKIHRLLGFDAVFLDIDMPAMNGFETAKQLTEINDRCYIIFVTSHNELVYDSFMFRPLNFIPKDTQDNMSLRLEKVIDQLSQQIKQNETIVLESRESGRFSVMIKDIVFIESLDHDVLYHIKGRRSPEKIRASISQLEQQLAQFDFVRVHKMYLVNFKYIFNISLTKSAVMLKQGKELPLGRRYKHFVNEQFTDYLRRTR